MQGYRSISIFSELARECCRALSFFVVMYDRTLRFSRGPARDKRARRRRRRGRKPGRYANRENGRGRWISRISEGLMDIRIPSAGGLPHVLPPFVVAFRPRYVINALEKKLSTLPTYLHHACCRRILVFSTRSICQPEILENTVKLARCKDEAAAR